MLDDGAAAAAGTSFDKAEPYSHGLRLHARGMPESVKRRIFDLMKYSLEDGEALPNSRSIAALEHFIEQAPEAALPLLGTDDTGLMVATWRKGQESMLSIKFDEGNCIHYAWTLENKKQVERSWGESSSGEFLASFAHRTFFLAGES